RLAEMRRLSEARDIRFDVVLLPYEYQVRNPTPANLLPQEIMAARLEAIGVSVHDAAPALGAQRGAAATLYAYGDGIHFSEKGHRAVFEFLREHIPTPTPPGTA